MATARKVKFKRSKSVRDAAQSSVPSANTGMIGGNLATVNTDSASGTISAMEASASSVPSANTAGASSSPGSARSATVRRGGSARSAAQGSQSQSQSQRNRSTGSVPARQITPFFEGANAYDPEIGYFRVAPGMTPEQTAQQIKAERAGRSRTVGR